MEPNWSGVGIAVLGCFTQVCEDSLFSLAIHWHAAVKCGCFPLVLGIEPTTLWMTRSCSPTELRPPYLFSFYVKLGLSLGVFFFSFWQSWGLIYSLLHTRQVVYLWAAASAEMFCYRLMSGYKNDRTINGWAEFFSVWCSLPVQYGGVLHLPFHFKLFVWNMI